MGYAIPIKLVLSSLPGPPGITIWSRFTADGDLTETKGFKSEDTSQYVGVGAEVTPLSWLAVRAGYRADMKGNDSNVFTGGVGFAPFNAVHVDLMGLYGEDETGAQGHS